MECELASYLPRKAIFKLAFTSHRNLRIATCDVAIHIRIRGGKENN